MKIDFFEIKKFVPEEGSTLTDYQGQMLLGSVSHMMHFLSGMGRTRVPFKVSYAQNGETISLKGLLSFNGELELVELREVNGLIVERQYQHITTFFDECMVLFHQQLEVSQKQQALVETYLFLIKTMERALKKQINSI